MCSTRRGWRLDFVFARRLIAAAALSSLLGGALACGDAKKSRRTIRRNETTEPAVVPEPVRAREPVRAPDPEPVAPPAPARVPARAADENDGARVASFRVEGVAADDVLNIRSQPDANSRVLSSIPPQEKHVEGLGAPSTVARSTWQRVRYAGVTGWVNARFLRANIGSPPSHEVSGAVEPRNPTGSRRAKDKGER
jgi:hypothetical protein